MGKPRITTAAVAAAYEVFDRYEVPAEYYRVSSQEQRNMRMAVVREALIAAQLADRQNPAPQPNVKWPIERQAASLAAMVTEYVEGGPHHDLQNGLKRIIAKRLRRFQPSPSADRVETTRANIEIATSLLKRASFDHQMDRITAELTVEALDAALATEGKDNG